MRRSAPVNGLSSRPQKRLKRRDAVEVPPHPRGIKPLGNALTAGCNLRDTKSAGLFRFLSDEILVHILGLLDATSLLKLGCTSRCMNAFSSLEELWKQIVVDSPAHIDAQWKGSWKGTFLHHDIKTYIQTPNLFSDILYRPIYCALHPIDPFIRDIPQSNLIPRVSSLSKSNFSEKYADKPFILTEPVKAWQCFDKWDTEKFVKEHAEIPFRAECVDWKLSTYYGYMRSCQYEESPLYLFDKNFVEKTNLGDKFSIPEIFQEDYFSVLGEQRPDRRWLIVGPAGSGSTFHKDPNATSAWNAVIQGEKYWLMFPPSTPSPPGVFVSEDQSEVTSPLSIMEWLIGFHAEARLTPGCLEGVCKAGEVIYVPSGWWHLVVNISESVAITQNFVPRAHLDKAYLFLRDQPQSISGFAKDICNPFEIFQKRLKEKHPDVFEDLSRQLARLSSEREAKRSKRWENLVQSSSSNGGFSFSFSGSGDEESEEEEA